jgi:hypothetical protein
MKIRISDQSLNKMSESAKDSIAQLSIIINTASADQIQALSDVIGTPIVASLNANRANVTNWFADMYTQQLEPSRRQQIDITRILEDIRNNTQPKTPPSTPAVTPSSTPSSTPSGTPVKLPTSTPSTPSTQSRPAPPARPPQPQGRIISPTTWKLMDKANRTIVLQDAANRFIAAGGTIDKGSKNVADPNVMTDQWKFITGNNKPISIKDVKSRMKNQRSMLNLRDFTLIIN